MIERYVTLRSQGKYYPCQLWADDEGSAETFYRAFQTALDFDWGNDGPNIPRIISLVGDSVCERDDDQGEYGFFIWEKKQLSSNASQYRVKMRMPGSIFTDK